MLLRDQQLEIALGLLGNLALAIVLVVIVFEIVVSVTCILQIVDGVRQVFLVKLYLSSRG